MRSCKAVLWVCMASAVMVGLVLWNYIHLYSPPQPLAAALLPQQQGPVTQPGPGSSPAGNRSLASQGGSQRQSTATSTAHPSQATANRKTHGHESQPHQAVIVEETSMGYGGRTLRETPPKEGGRFLIFECVSEQSLCGGWADRQEGLVTVFLLAYLTHRRFGIHISTPCELSQFVVPNDYNWIVPEAVIKGNSTRHISAVDNLAFIREVHTADFNAKYPEDVVFLRTNRDMFTDITTNPRYRNALPSWANQSKAEFFRDVWHTLMKPVPSIQQRLKGFLQSINYFHRTRPLLGVHLRTGANKGFADSDNRDLLSRIGVLWAFLQPDVDQGSNVFVATDNAAVRNSSLARFGPRHHDTGAVLRHIDRQRSDPAICKAFGDAILDQLILTRCDVIVITTGRGFSSRAAMIRGINKQLFAYGGQRVSPVNMRELCFPVC